MRSSAEVVGACHRSREIVGQADKQRSVLWRQLGGKLLLPALIIIFELALIDQGFIPTLL